MVRRLHFGLSLFASLLLVGPASADEEFESLWSATLMGQLRVISDEEARNGVGGFFDQYDFTPNKSSALPFELGIRDASYDLLGSGETPRLQFRLQSPTSNLGVSGSQIGSPFLNQRVDLLGRFQGIHFDLDYRRIRTEELRLFPVSIPGVGPQFTDLTSPNDRFFHERTGFTGELRVRPADMLDREVGWLDRLTPELALRGGYQGRDGQSQYRFLVEPQNLWSANTREQDQSVGDIGGGVLISPDGLFTLALDFDHKRFRENARFTLQSDLSPPVASSSRTIGFIPDTDMSTGTLRLNSRIGDRAVLEGGFQVSRVEQVGDLTPAQRANGLKDNSVLYYSANFAADISIADRVSANAFFKFDQRDNDIQRDTSLFNPLNGTQVGGHLEQWRRFVVGFEASYRPALRSRVALGVRFEAIDRELDFVPASTGGLRILPRRRPIWCPSGRRQNGARHALRIGTTEESDFASRPEAVPGRTPRHGRARAAFRFAQRRQCTDRRANVDARLYHRSDETISRRRTRGRRISPATRRERSAQAHLAQDLAGRVRPAYTCRRSAPAALHSSPAAADRLRPSTH